MDSYYDLGSHSFPVTTGSVEAQRWFDRGLVWIYAYNHAEAVLCFDHAIAADPGCAMAHWGKAYALGPTYNMPWNRMDKAMRAAALAGAHAATQTALALADGAAGWEAALIRALPARYPQAEAAEIETMRGWDRDFAVAMRAAFRAHPESREVRAAFAEAMMNVTPWKMWDLASGMPAEDAMTEEVRAVLEEALEADPEAMRHPGLLHLYVHLMEMSPVPEKALKAGDVLRTLVPDAGHLIHMPTHIDVLCGHYADVLRWNEAAMVADRRFRADPNVPAIYTGYRLHNCHFAIYGAMFLGQFEPAMRAVQRAAEIIPEAVLRIESPPMANFFEAYLAFAPHVLVRFGKWREALALGLPDDPELRCTLTAHVHYAKGLAHAALGDPAAAEAEERLYQAAVARVPETRLLHNNRVVDLLAIGTEMLRGEILYRQGAHDAAFAALRRAIALEDGLPYDEPWGWMQPVRHALGALTLEQGRLDETEAVFREDLGLGGRLSRATIHPDNVWSLRGLHDCLKARGETSEIVQVRQRLNLAEARADRRVAASCFCAQAALAAG